MCGFIGLVSLSKINKDGVLTRKFDRAYHFLKSRGPDEKRVWSDDNSYFLHTRLKILDLGSTGSQPMQRGQYTICFNGEIYNFNSIKKNLIKKGHRFTSTGDTEVLLLAWKEWGENMLNKLDGMFSMAIWDSKLKSLFLARDRFGKKPLVYAIENNKVYFASDVKSLNCIIDGGGVSKDAIKSLFRFRFIHEPLTIYNKFKKLLPGKLLIFNKYGTNYRKWFEIKNKTVLKKNISTKYLKSLILKAVEKRLVSDVSIGVFLSGGLDSAIVMDSLCKLGKKVPTFSIGFEYESSYYNEASNAKKIADYYGFKNNTINLNSQNIISHINNILEASDEPFADSSSIATYMISQAVNKKIKVALTGDGGDELFGGYRKYIAYRWLPLTNSIPVAIKKLLLLTLSDNKNNYFKEQSRKLKRLLENSNLDILKTQINFLDQLTEYDFYNLFDENKSLLNESLFSASKKFEDKLNKVLVRDFNFSLLGDMLVKLDRYSMANSLEIRSPFLDKDLVDYAFSIPGKEKIGFLKGKKIIRRAYNKDFPNWYLNLPKKGFEVPLQKWLTNELKYLVDEATEKNVIESLDIKKPSIISEWKTDFLNGKSDNSWKLWTLITYSNWAKNNNVI